MMKSDPLDLLGDLPDFPGKTPPKNRSGAVKPFIEDKYNGAKSQVYRINGEEIRMFTIGALSKALNRKPITIRSWEHKGWIPKANFRKQAPQNRVNILISDIATKGDRLYSVHQVDFLIDCVGKFNLDDKVNGDWNGFRNHVRAHWPTK
jgi:hypothetical protein